MRTEVLAGFPGGVDYEAAESGPWLERLEGEIAKGEGGIAVLGGLHGDFAAVITAEDVGAYKPADNHFRALDRTLAELGVRRSELLHVAQSLFHDHVPARREGLSSVWINRRHDRAGWGATPEPADEWSYDAEFASMGDFADAVDLAFG